MNLKSFDEFVFEKLSTREKIIRKWDEAKPYEKETIILDLGLDNSFLNKKGKDISIEDAERILKVF